MATAYAVGKSPSITLIRPDELDKECYKAHELLHKSNTVPVDLKESMSQVRPTWSVYSSANYNSYWPYSYFADTSAKETYWFDNFSHFSPLHRRDLFSRWLYNADYMANPHFWNYPYANWTRYRGYLYDQANPSFYAQEYYYMTHV